MAKRAAATRAKPQPTRYANVDLDVYASAPLDDLVKALGDEVLVLFVGGMGSRYEAHLELNSTHRHASPDDTIVGLTRLVQRLPRVHRKVWNSARRREFNIGIEAGFAPHAFEIRLQPETLKAITGVAGTVVVTVYAAGLPATPSRD